MEFQTIIPEILLAVGAMLLLLAGTFRQGDGAGSFVLVASVVLLVFCAALVALGRSTGTAAFGGTLTFDAFGRFAKVLVLGGSAVALLISRNYLRRMELLKPEYPVLFLFAALGMAVMVSASDLITLYLGLELQSLSLYVLAAFRRDAIRSTESGLKYFVLGALSSGLLLYGASLVYGATGVTGFAGIAAALEAQGAGTGLRVGLAFVAAGIAFKVSAVPFHMWTPDVYEGAPSPVTAFFASAPKVAAAILFARLLHVPFGGLVQDWQQILVFLAVASMALGGVAAIGQTNLKRLMAYSSIGHMGYALVGLAAGTRDGVTALLTYLAIYLVMNLGVFAFLVTMTRDNAVKLRVQDLAGLSRTQPAAALCIAALMFSLAGVPPLVGFFAKLFVFRAAIDAGLIWLAVAGVLASVIAAFYYLRIVKVMYVDPPDARLDEGMQWEHRVVLGVAAFAMAVGWLPFLDGFGLTEAAAAAARSLIP